jgi:hypothetical protein
LAAIACVHEDHDAMRVPHGLGYIKTSADANPRPLTAVEVEAVFTGMAALGNKIAFKYLMEGCECRSQLMIEEMLAVGIDPGRVWAMTVPGKTLSVPNPLNPKQPIRWHNHTAPVIALDPTPGGFRVIDPSLPGVRGPLTIVEWAASIRLLAYEMSDQPLSQAEMLSIFAERTRNGQSLHGFVFVVERGVSPVSDIKGSGFRLDVDPPQGVSEFAHERMQDYLKIQAQMPSSDR